MRTRVKCWDYREAESFPYLDFMSGEILWYPCSEQLYEAWDPDEIENDEFNLVILLHKYPVRVRSCNFDFVNEEEFTHV